MHALSMLLIGGVFAAAPAKDSDPLLIGTVWKGTLTQKGEFMGVGDVPPEFECVFTVTKRDGDKFEAELFEMTKNLKLTYVVRGTVKPTDKDNPDKGYRVEFESVDSKDVENTEAITKIPYTATLKGKTLKGTWKYPANNEMTTLEGTFAFELGKKQE
jgi:hypothetical protein